MGKWKRAYILPTRFYVIQLYLDLEHQLDKQELVKIHEIPPLGSLKLPLG